LEFPLLNLLGNYLFFLYFLVLFIAIIVVVVILYSLEFTFIVGNIKEGLFVEILCCCWYCLLLLVSLYVILIRLMELFFRINLCEWCILENFNKEAFMEIIAGLYISLIMGSCCIMKITFFIFYFFLNFYLFIFFLS
jgi:hypothetical protein